MYNYLKHVTAVCSLLSLMCVCGAQEKFVLNPGQKPSDVLSPQTLYRFPDFKKGTVAFLDATKIEASLNYNLFTQTVQFISPGGDTLSLADENLIKEIKIDSCLYLFNKGYYEWAGRFQKARFLLRKTIAMASAKKIGAYGQTVEGGANSYTSFSNGASDVHLVVNEKVTLVKEESLFFSDENGAVTTASKRNFLGLLKTNKEAVEEYAEKNKINFAKKEDVLKLIAYVNGL